VTRLHPIFAEILDSVPLAPASPSSPTPRQVALYQALAASPAFTDEERERIARWIDAHGTKARISDQIDALRAIIARRIDAAPGTPTAGDLADELRQQLAAEEAEANPGPAVSTELF
jgi:hypothetical protein